MSVAVFTNKAVPGWASTLLPIYFLGGLQILCLGIMGSYLGKIYIESKSRPKYFIERTIGMTNALDHVFNANKSTADEKY